MLWYQGAQNVGLSNRKLKSALNGPCDQTDGRADSGQTDEHHGNSATIHFNERIAR